MNRSPAEIYEEGGLRMKQTRNGAAVWKTSANRNYKSTIFAMLFEEKERLLRLYNAVSGKNYTDPEEAVERTIIECIQEGILKEFLEKNRAEVKKVSIYEYDREEHIRMEKQESWEDGVREGILRGEEKQLCKMITKKLKKGKTISQIAEELEEEEEKIQELIAAHDLDSI